MKGGWPLGWLRRSAAQWFVRLRGEPVTARLDAKFRRWLASNPENEVNYERQELAWELAGELAQDAEIEALIHDAQRSPRRASRVPRAVLVWSAAAAALVAAVGIGLYAVRPGEVAVYATAVGEQRTVVLPDQSRMMLNTHSRVRVAFERDVRVVELEYGEATFSVARDANRPFEVRAAQGTARALGTQFNVLSSADEVTVSVLEGKVEVVAALAATGGSLPRSAVLLHGQEVRYNDVAMSAIGQADSVRINAWHAGRISFEGMALREALREFNRYGTTPIVLSEESLATLRVSGVFRIGETQALLRALNTAFDIEAHERPDAIELRRASDE
jgi:transmembrane sensor